MLITQIEQLQKIIRVMLGIFTVAELYEDSHVYLRETSFQKITKQRYSDK